MAGEVVLVSKATGLALCAGAEATAPLKELLGEEPPVSAMVSSKLFAYHSIADYAQIARTLTAS